MLTYIHENISLTPWASQGYVQGPQGSCTAVAVYNMISLVSNLYGDPFRVNVQTLYNMSLIEQGTPGQDIGVDPTRLMTYLENVGVTERDTIPYGPQYLNVTPSAGDYADAGTHTISSWEKIDTNYGIQLTAWEIAGQLREGKPVLMALRVQQWLTQADGPLGSQAGKYIPGVNFNTDLGNHELLIVGIDTQSMDVQVMSWGTGGDRGFYKINLEALSQQPYIVGDGPGGIQGLYAIHGFNGVDLKQDEITDDVANAYNAILNRAPEHSAMVNAAAYLRDGGSLSGLCNIFASSGEFKSNLPVGANNTQIASYLYSTILGRAPDAVGLSFWVGALDAGASIGNIASGMIIDIEDKAHWAMSTNLYTGDNLQLMNESLRLMNRAQASENYAITLQAGDEYGAVSKDFLTHITNDPNSVIVSMIGIPEQIGHEHIVPTIL